MRFGYRIFPWMVGLSLLAATALEVSAQQVTVLTNQAMGEVSFWVVRSDESREAKTLQVGESMVVPFFATPQVVYQPKDQPVWTPLQPDGIQVFSDHSGTLELLFLGPEYPEETAKKTAAESIRSKDLPILTLPVKVYMDVNIPLHEDVWKRGITERFAKASEVLERTCRIRLEIQEYTTWRPRPNLPNIQALMEDFEKQLPRPTSGVLHIGFTNNRKFGDRSVIELGAARYPFYPVIFLREEAPQVTNVERLDTLLHEIGHFLGAAHTMDQNSLMRPQSKDRRSRFRDFHISFDPFNTLAMNLWLREYRATGQKKVTAIHRDTQIKLMAVYRMIQNIAEQQAEITKQPPEENQNLVALLALLEGKKPEKKVSADPPPAEEKTAEEEPAEEESTKTEKPAEKTETPKKPAEEPKKKPAYNPEDPLGITETPTPKKKSTPRRTTSNVSPVEELTEIRAQLLGEGWETEVVERFALPAKTTQFILASTLLAMNSEEILAKIQTKKLIGDACAEQMVRFAADAALEVGGNADASTPEGRIARQAFVLALETMLEPSGKLKTLPIYGKRFLALETTALKRIRKQTVPTPTIFDRSDLSQHFWLSAALATHIEPRAVEIIGLEKERRDAQPGGSGFDVTDLNADISGVLFVEKLMDGTLSLEKIAKDFTFSQVIPSKITLPKSLKHPSTPKEEDETVRLLRESASQLYTP